MADDGETEQSPWTRPGWVVSAAVVALIVIMGVIVIVISAAGDDEDDPPRPNETATTTDPEARPEDDPAEFDDADSDSVCGLQATDTTGTLPIGPDVTWSPIVTTAGPVSEEHGPGLIEEDGFRSCYSQTPAGALLFAANFVAMGDDADLAYRSIEELTVPGRGRDAALDQPQGNDDPSLRLRIVGFRLLHYNSDEASVDLAVQGGGELMSFVFDLVWLDGDWRLDLADTGQMRTPPGPIPDLQGYIAWSEG